LHSGSLLLALSFSRRALVRDTPYAQDIAALVGDDWVQLLKAELDSGILERALEWALSRPRHELLPLDDFGWDRIGEQTLAFYRDVRATRREGAAVAAVQKSR
jgi:hypothetical protein